jgi:hypothetical protein
MSFEGWVHAIQSLFGSGFMLGGAISTVLAPSRWAFLF